jgi:hypothetical protein
LEHLLLRCQKFKKERKQHLSKWIFLLKGVMRLHGSPYESIQRDPDSHLGKLLLGGAAAYVIDHLQYHELQEVGVHKDYTEKDQQCVSALCQRYRKHLFEDVARFLDAVMPTRTACLWGTSAFSRRPHGYGSASPT